ncbi:MAG: TetR/AcrR family transcriptional regulator [Planctomycetaceae bacterium]
MGRPQTISDEEILESARECFFDHGPSVATEVIAERLGVSPQALYKRFGSKRNLMTAAMLPCTAPGWIRLVESGPDDRPMQEQLVEFLNELAVFFVDIVRRMSVLRFAGCDLRELSKRFTEPPPVRDIRVISEWFERAHQRGLIRQADYKATAMMLLSALHGPAMIQEMLGRHPTGQSQEDYVAHVADVLLRGLK